MAERTKADQSDMKPQKRISRAVIVAVLLVGLYSPAHALEINNLPKPRPEIQKLMQEHECMKVWNILWPEAKSGDIEARAYLAFLSMPLMHSDALFMPGDSGDNISRLRDALILTIHSKGFIFKTEDTAKDGDIYNFMYSRFIDKYLGRNYFKCMNEKNSQECAKVAVKDKLVPAFEDYAKKIDMLVAQGARPTCDFYPDDGAVDTSETGGK